MFQILNSTVSCVPLAMAVTALAGLACVLLVVPLCLNVARADEQTDQMKARLSEEADAFLKLAPQVIGTETMRQQALKPPSRFRPLFVLNPLSAIVEGFRSSIVFGQAPDWTLSGAATLLIVAVLTTAFVTFKRMDKYFADVI